MEGCRKRRTCQNRTRSEIYGMRHEEERELEKALKLSLAETSSSPPPSPQLKSEPVTDYQRLPQTSTIYTSPNEIIPLDLVSDDEEGFTSDGEKIKHVSQEAINTNDDVAIKSSLNPSKRKTKPVLLDMNDYFSTTTSISSDSSSSSSVYSGKKKPKKFKSKKFNLKFSEKSTKERKKSRPHKDILISTPIKRRRLSKEKLLFTDSHLDSYNFENISPSPLLSSCGYQAQRKFPQNQIRLQAMNHESCLSADDEILPEKIPKTEDFLLYLCLRKSRSLPKELLCFDNPWTPRSNKRQSRPKRFDSNFQQIAVAKKMGTRILF